MSVISEKERKTFKKPSLIIIMPKRKLSSEMESDIVALAKRGILYKDIIKAIADKYKIWITTMSVSKVITRFKKEFGEDFVKTFISEDMRLEEKSQLMSLNSVLTNTLELCENLILDLKEKYENEGLEFKDFKMLESLIDRATRLRIILYPSVGLEVESFQDKIKKKFKIDK